LRTGILICTSNPWHAVPVQTIVSGDRSGYHAQRMDGLSMKNPPQGWG
jgi:hypothetical protein